MSLILDALRKLDREKSSRRRGGPDIASEILRDGPASARGKGYRYAAAFSLTALLAAGLTYALLAGIGLPGKKLPPEHPLPPAPNQAHLAAPEKPVLSAKIPSSESAVPPVLRKQPPAAPASSAPRGKASTSEGGEPASLPKQPTEISPGTEMPDQKRGYQGGVGHLRQVAPHQGRRKKPGGVLQDAEGQPGGARPGMGEAGQLFSIRRDHGHFGPGEKSFQ